MDTLKYTVVYITPWFPSTMTEVNARCRAWRAVDVSAADRHNNAQQSGGIDKQGRTRTDG